MSETRYLISEAARITQVEAHVLRYWEEELGLVIGRNKMGHRYYTDKDIRTFMNIKELKKKGLQLRAIREMLPGMEEQEGEKELPKVIVMSPQVFKEREEDMQEENTKEFHGQASGGKISGEQPLKEERKREIPEKSPENETMKGKETALQGKHPEPPEKVKRETKEERFGEIMERLIHQLENSERKEGRYRRLDEAIRKHQQSRRLVAATEEGGKRKPGKKKNRT